MISNGQAAFDMAPGKNPHVVRQTSAAAISLPDTMALARVVIEGHATEPTILGVRYAGQYTAMFYCEPAGRAVYDITWADLKTLGADVVTVISDDSPVSWTLTFDDEGYGPDISEYRGVQFEAEVADSGTAVSVSLPVVAQPKAFIAGQTLVAASTAFWTFQSIGSRTVVYNCPGTGSNARAVLIQCPPIPAADTVTITPTLTGAASATRGVLYF